jgi:hypothetical protein
MKRRHARSLWIGVVCGFGIAAADGHAADADKRAQPPTLEEARSWVFPTSADGLYPDEARAGPMPAARVAELRALIERRFAFAPSLTDLYRYGLLIEQAHPDTHAEYSEAPLPKDATFDGMKRVLRAGLTGGGYQNPWPLSPTSSSHATDLMRDTLRQTRTALPIAKPSMFASRSDLFVAIGQPFAERERSRLGPPGVVVFRTPETSDQALFDFAKTAPDTHFTVEFGPREAGGDGTAGYWDIGLTTLTFQSSPPAWAITRDGAMPVHLRDLRVSAAGVCRGSANSLRVTMDQAPKSPPLIFLALRTPADPAKVRVRSRSQSASEIDANGDGIVDLVLVETTRAGELEREFVTTVIALANISGEWQFVTMQQHEECT